MILTSNIMMTYYYYYCIFSDEEINDEEEAADVEKEQRGGRKFPRSAVDDNFFRFVFVVKRTRLFIFSVLLKCAPFWMQRISESEILKLSVLMR